MSDAARDWEQQLIEEQELLESDSTVKEVAIILLTRDVTGTPWLDWDVWAEQCTDDDRLDALRTAQAVVEYMRERGAAVAEVTGSTAQEPCTCGVAWGTAEGPCVCEPSAREPEDG